MRVKLLSVFAAALLLAACGSSGDDSGAATGSGDTMSSGSGTEIQGPTPGSQEDLTVDVGDRVFFAFDSANLEPEAQVTVERLAAWLKQFQDVTLTIEGHADERGTREYNLALGERRASSVKDYLVSLGINPGRLTTVSYGEEQPAVLGSNEEAWAQNRRAVFVVN